MFAWGMRRCAPGSGCSCCSVLARANLSSGRGCCAARRRIQEPGACLHSHTEGRCAQKGGGRPRRRAQTGCPRVHCGCSCAAARAAVRRLWPAGHHSLGRCTYSTTPAELVHARDAAEQIVTDHMSCAGRRLSGSTHESCCARPRTKTTLRPCARRCAHLAVIESPSLWWGKADGRGSGPQGGALGFMYEPPPGLVSSMPAGMDPGAEEEDSMHQAGAPAAREKKASEMTVALPLPRNETSNPACLAWVVS